MLHKISQFALPTLGAMAIGFGHLPKAFGRIGKFSKCAVVADESWIKAYGHDKVAQAEAWLAEDT